MKRSVSLIILLTILILSGCSRNEPPIPPPIPPPETPVIKASKELGEAKGQDHGYFYANRRKGGPTKMEFMDLVKETAAEMKSKHPNLDEDAFINAYIKSFEFAYTTGRDLHSRKF